MSPNHWYPGAFSEDIGRSKVVPIQFWGKKIALYRDAGGRTHAVDDQCPHRGIKLSHGTVEGCNLVCLYHGWTFDPKGDLVGTKHDSFGKKLPVVSVGTYPTRERYGIVWFFPGDPALAEITPLVEVTHAEGEDRWVTLHFAYTWAAHHSMVIDNLCNLTHLWVHGRWVPYGDTVLSDSSAEGDRLTLSWHHELRRDVLHPITSPFFRASRGSNESDTFMIYDYPYQSALSNGRVRSTNFMLPIDERHTKVFTYQLWQPPRQIERRGLSRRLAALAMPLIRPITKEIFRQDGFTVEEEQLAFEESPDRPIPEPNPMVKRFNQLTVRKWEDYVAAKTHGALSEAQLLEQARVKVI